MFKRSFLLLLVVVMCISIIAAGCGKGEQSVNNSLDTEDVEKEESEDKENNSDGQDDRLANMNPEGLPIVKEKVTYTMACSLAPNWGKPDEGEFWETMEQETNVHIEWISYLSNEASEKFNLMMAAGEYPDAFIGGYGGGDTDLITYGSQGIYIPLNDLIDKYAPNLKMAVEKENPDLLTLAIAPDGNIYGLPRLLSAIDTKVYNNMFINEVWLKNLNLEPPKTTDEFAAVLRAFKENDANDNGDINDEIPLSFLFTDWGAYDHGGYFGAFGYPLTPDYTIIDNAKVVFMGDQPGYKEAAKWLSSLYSEGLIDKEIFTQDQSQFGAKGSAEPATIGVFHSWDRNIVAGDTNMDEYIPLYPLTGPNGECNWTWEGFNAYGRNAFIITDKAENPEILMRWVDEFYRDYETGLNAIYGPGGDEGKTWFFNKEGKMQLSDNPPPEYERGQQNLPFAPAILGDVAAEEIVLETIRQEKESITQMYKPACEKFISGQWSRFPPAFMTAEEAEELATLEADLLDYAKSQLARWIVGEGDVEAEWDNYINELDNIGLSRWLELKQTIYDRTK